MYNGDYYLNYSFTHTHAENCTKICTQCKFHYKHPKTLMDLLKSFETDGSVLRADCDLEKVWMESQTSVKTETLAQDSLVVVLDHVHDG